MKKMDLASLRPMNQEPLLILKNKYKLVEYLEEIGPKTFENPIDDTMLSVISHKCSKLSKMNLQGEPVIDGIEAMLFKCTTLHTLKVSDCKDVVKIHFPIAYKFKKIVLNNLFISDITVEYLKNCTNLTKLRLTRCPHISDQALESLSKETTSLKYLSLEGSEGITQKGVEKILKYCTRIQDLDLTNCRNIKDLTLPIEASKLQVLILEGTRISHPLFTSLLLLGDLQRKLCMPSHKLPNKEKKERLEKGVVQLTRAFDKDHSAPLTSLALRTLGEIKKMQSQFEKKSIAYEKLSEAENHLLEAIKLDSKEDATTYRLLGDVYRMQKSLSSLLEVKISDEKKLLEDAKYHLEKSQTLDPNHPITTLLLEDINRMQTNNKQIDELKAHLDKSKESTRIDISQYKNVVDDQILKSISNNANLKELNLAGCTLITHQGIEFFLQHCPSLQELNLTNCNGIADLHLPIEASKLEVLHLQGTSILKPKLASHWMLGDLQRLQSDSLIGEKKAEKLEKAEQYYKKALALDPKYFDALLGLGVVQMARSSFEDAKKTLEAALEQQPKDHKCLIKLGTLHTHLSSKLYKEKKENEVLEELEKALNYFMDALKTKPLHITTLLRCGIVKKDIAARQREEKMKTLEEASSYLTTAANITKDTHFDILYHLIEVLLLQCEGKIEKDKAQFLKVAKEKIDNACSLQASEQKKIKLETLIKKYNRLIS